MERLKQNKFSLMLFIATIAMIVTFVISIFIISITLGNVEQLVVEAAKESGQSLSQSEIDLAVTVTKTGIIVVYVLGAILMLFVALCGFKCALQGKWRIGAIVFGIIYTIDEVYSFFDAIRNHNIGTTVISVIYLVISIFYLLGAVKSDSAKIDAKEPQEFVVDKEE